MNIVFIGSANFSLSSFNEILHSNHQVLCLVTSPEKKAGRGLKPHKNPLVSLALKHNIEVRRPEKISDEKTIKDILSFKPDAIVVVAYGQKIPKELLFTPPFKCINVHGSLLPRWRGASPIHYAILEGDKKTGVTTMLMEESMDTGDILLQEEIDIPQESTTATLHDILAPLGAKLIVKTLNGLEENEIKQIHQDTSLVTLAKKIKKEQGLIDFKKPAEFISRMVRAFDPWPGSFFYCNNKQIKVWKCRLINDTVMANSKMGCVLSRSSSDGLLIQTGTVPIRLEIVQMEGKSKMNDVDFLNGHPEFFNAILSD